MKSVSIVTTAMNLRKMVPHIFVIDAILQDSGMRQNQLAKVCLLPSPSPSQGSPPPSPTSAPRPVCSAVQNSVLHRFVIDAILQDFGIIQNPATLWCVPLPLPINLSLALPHPNLLASVCFSLLLSHVFPSAAPYPFPSPFLVLQVCPFSFSLHCSLHFQFRYKMLQDF